MKVLKSRLYDYYNSKYEKEYADNRKSQIGSGDRSERIRTYNFPQNRVTDHRYNISSFDLPKIMQGDLGLILDQILQLNCERRLEELRQN